jgi:hypothetical protein
MLTVNTKTLGLIDVQMGEPERAKLRVNFPLNRAAGTEGGAVVYFEVQPGDYLATHTDSPEEILYIVSGSAEAHVGDERGSSPPATSRSSRRWRRTACARSATSR